MGHCLTSMLEPYALYVGFHMHKEVTRWIFSLDFEIFWVSVSLVLFSCVFNFI